jgi:predicted dehydrogenase
MRLRTTIVGLGRVGCGLDLDLPATVGASHAGAAALCPDTVLAGGVDLNPERRARFEGAFGAPAFATQREMLEQLKPDAVCVCTPTDSHATLCLEALDAGVRALVCEKPLAASPAEAEALVARARECGAVLATAHWMRWSAPWSGAAGLLAARGLGDVAQVRYVYAKGLYNSGTHALDILRMLFGDIAEAVALASHPLDTGEANVDGRVRFAAGTVADLRTVDYRGHFTTECDILGNGGRLVLGDRTGLWLPERPGGRLAPAHLPFPDRDPVPPFVAMLSDLVRCRAEGGQPRCSGRDGLAALRAAEALRLSQERGGRPVNPNTLDIDHA